MHEELLKKIFLFVAFWKNWNSNESGHIGQRVSAQFSIRPS